MTYPAIIPSPLTGTEPLANTTLSSFWAWAYSNLMDNAERGVLAEYLVHLAVGGVSSTRTNWDRYDVLSPEGIAIEVKASGYIQTWSQDKLSSIQFSIRPTIALDEEKNNYAGSPTRQSDIYVFCVHKHTDQETINPLDTEQWEFYVLPTIILNEKVGSQKTITLNRIKELGALVTKYSDLQATILSACDCP